MQDNISCALITAFERQYDTSWDDPKLRNERLAMRYGWTAAMEAKQCLHQIQEPAAAEQAAWHAGLDEGRAQATGSVSNATSQAAPAAVAVPDAAAIIRNLVDHIERNTCEHHETYRGGAIWEVCSDCGAKWADDQGGKPSFKWPDAVERAREFLLAATPAAAPDMVSVKQVDANKYCQILAALGMEEEGDPVAEVQNLQALAVTSILLDVVPGSDGMGHEVYATSVEDVVEKLSDLGSRLEDYQLGIAVAPQALAGHRDVAFEAVRQKFCKLQRYSFFLDDKGNVRCTPDYSGNWVEFEAVHTLFDPAAVDTAIAAQAAPGG